MVVEPGPFTDDPGTGRTPVHEVGRK